MKFKYKSAIKILIFTQLFFVFSCRTNKVPEGEYLYIGSEFKYKDKKGQVYENESLYPFIDILGKEEEKVTNRYKEPFSDELVNYIKQRPNKKLLFMFPLGLWFHNFSDKRFDGVYNEYYKLEAKRRNQKLLDSLFTEQGLERYLGKSRWLDRLFYNNGDAPELISSDITKINTNNLNQYFINRGWRKSEIEDTLSISGKKAKTQYNIKLNRPTLIESVSYNVADEIIEESYNRYVRIQKRNKKEIIQLKEEFTKQFFSRSSLIEEGGRLDAYVLGEEISRIEDRFKNMGYFRFNDLKDEVYYVADTAKSIYNVPLTVTIKKSKLTSEGNKEPRFKRSYVNKVEVLLDVEESLPASKIKNNVDSTYYVIDKKIVKLEEGKKVKTYVKDTLAQIINGTEGRYKNRVLADILTIEQRSVYRLNSESETRRNISKVNNFNLISFNTRFENNSDSTLVTTIRLSSMPKFSYELGFEAFVSKVANYGITPNITFTAKNVFRGAENLNISLGGSIGNIDSQNSENKNNLFNASEFSIQTSLTFPRLLLPFNTQKIIPKRWTPSSSIYMGFNAQYNIGLDKRNYITGISYNFSPTRTTLHQITLWNVQYTQFMNPGNYFSIYKSDAAIREGVFEAYFKDPNHEDIKDAYYNKSISAEEVQRIIGNDLEFANTNPKLMEDYRIVELRRFRYTQNTLISSFKYDFTYDQRSGFFPRKNPFFLKAQVELAGNVLSLFNSSMKGFTTTNNQTIKEIFGVPYSQFVKLDLDIRKYWNLNSTQSINARFLTGIGIPYGNSFIMPFDRSYSVGGPSDLRAWRAFGVGPGSSRLAKVQNNELIALESFKLFSSVEYRFPLPSKNFEGALFVDAGNVWGINNDSQNKFEFDKFYKELGIGGGVGIRWNISNFIIRFDFAYKFHDPAQDESDRWYFQHIQPLKPQVNFAIDYPF